MTVTSDKLKEAAFTFGWKHQGITANHGKIHHDYFARGLSLIVVVYDAHGRIFQVQRMRNDRMHVIDEHLGAGTAGKFKRVVSWFRVESK